MKPIVIYADDEFSSLNLFKLEAEEYKNFTPVTVSTGEEVLELIDSKPDNYQVVILDINMGVAATGLEIARKIKSSHPEITTLVYSGYEGEVIETVTKESGAVFVYKNLVSMTSLLGQVSKIIETGKSA